MASTSMGMIRMRETVAQLARMRLRPDEVDALRFLFCAAEAEACGVHSNFGANVDYAVHGVVSGHGGFDRADDGSPVGRLLPQEKWMNFFGYDPLHVRVRATDRALRHLCQGSGRRHYLVLWRYYGPRDPSCDWGTFGEWAPLAALTPTARELCDRYTKRARREHGAKMAAQGRKTVEAAKALREGVFARMDALEGTIATERETATGDGRDELRLMRERIIRARRKLAVTPLPRGPQTDAEELTVADILAATSNLVVSPQEAIAKHVKRLRHACDTGKGPEKKAAEADKASFIAAIKREAEQMLIGASGALERVLREGVSP